MMAIPTCTCGIECACYKFVHEMIEKEQLIQLLVGFNDVYKTIRGSILMTRPLPCVSEAYHMLLQEEHQREMSSSNQIVHESVAFKSNLHPAFSISQDSLAFMGNNHIQYNGRNSTYNGRNAMYNPGYNTRNNHGHDLGHGDNNSGYGGKIPGSTKQLYCDHYKITGHTVQRCYKLHRYPPGH